MKFRKGNRVRFLNDVGGGIISRIDENGSIYVLSDDGFEIPVTEKELVLAGNFNYQPEQEIDKTTGKNETTARETKVEKRHQIFEPVIPSKIPADVSVSVLIGFVPENTGPVFSSSIACYLINDSPYFIYFLAGKKEGGSLYYLSSGNIEADTKTMLASFDQTSLSKISDLHLQLLFVNKGRYQKMPPVDRMVNLNLVNFSKESYYRENEYFDDKAVLFTIIGDSKDNNERIVVSDEVLKEKSIADVSETKAKKKEPVSDTLEVDLHFDEETMKGSQLTPGAILALQMSRFHSAVEEAISKNLKRLVIIHGLGQGTLKMQIRKELQEKYPAFIYQDASFKEYGFGATMVHIVTDHKQ